MTRPPSQRPQRPPSSPAPAGRADASTTPGAAPGVARVAPTRGTLPPPDWAAPRSVSALALQWLADKAPVSRRRGGRADLAALEAEYRTAVGGADTERLRAACKALARALVGRGMEFDRATKLARRALMLRDDQSLREELSLWFAALGESMLAAATLRPLEGVVEGPLLAKVLVRIAVFCGRSGDAGAAQEALLRAAEADLESPLPPELVGGLAAWAPEEVERDAGARGYLEGARRRDAASDPAGAFEDLLRAFDVSPGSPGVAHRLATQLGSRGRAGAADEVLRESAAAAGPEAARLHVDRMRQAALEGEFARALGAALDAGEDARASLDELVAAVDAAMGTSSDAPVTFDALLASTGLEELLAARLALAAELAEGAERARALVALGRLHAGPLGNPDRATEAWIDAVVADPSHEEAKAGLREHAAAMGDSGALVEALIRASSAGGPEQGRHDCVQELLLLAEQKLGDPALALWAADRMLLLGADVDTVQSVVERLAPRAKALDDELARERAAAEGADDAARVEQLAWIVDHLESRPQDVDQLVDVLRELCQRAPDERRWRGKLTRVLERIGDRVGLEELLGEDLRPGRPRGAADASRAALATLRHRAGDTAGAAEHLRGSLDEVGPARMSWCAAFALAAHAGDRETRARALARLSRLVRPAIRAVTASVAAEELLAVGKREAAREAAEEACHADPSAPRAIVALSRALAGNGDRAAALSLERAMGSVVVRSRACEALADLLASLDDETGALAWTQRWVALRPGDPRAAQALLDRVVKTGDAARLADVLSFLVAQPQPLGDRGPAIARALCRLAELDPERGVATGRRALDVFGPRVPELRGAVLAVADAAGHGGLAIALLERQLASGAPGGDRAELLLDLARRRRTAGDGDGAAMTLVRALRDGADADRVLAELDVALPPETADGEVALLRARAEGFSGSASSDLQATAQAWRRFGAALWDMVGDRAGAMNAWMHAASLDPDEGMEKLARDLVSFAGHAEAVEILLALVTDETEPKIAGDVLTCAAGVALDHGMGADALSAGLRALDVDPSRADVLAVLERAAGPDDVDALERAYERVAEGALGIYGTRAAHYRAARQLERRGERARALRHAVAAFEAVPAEGVTFVLMMRLAERLGESSDAVAAIDRVASAARTAAARSAWLRRAALVAGTSEEGKRQRVDVLLRALEATPDRDTLRSLGRALADLNRAAPEEREIGEMRFRRAVKRTLERCEGPEGARAGVDAAKAALEAFGAVDLAVESLRVAVGMDASIDEYAELTSEVATLAAEPGSGDLVADVSDLCDAEYSNVGHAICDLAVQLAEALGDRRVAASILVSRAEKQPEDVDLLRRARGAAAEVGDAELSARIASAQAPEQRAQELYDAGMAAERTLDDAAAAAAFEEVRTLPSVPPSQHAAAGAKLEGVYARLGRTESLEELLRERVAAAPDAPARDEAVIALARVLITRGQLLEARERTTALLDQSPKDVGLIDAVVALAREADDASWQAEVLQRRVEETPGRTERLALLRRLAVLHEKASDPANSVACYRRILELDDRDITALSAMERDAERRADTDALVELLERHAKVLTSSEETRRMRLRRAELLETKLGRLDEARAALEAMLRAGEHPDVLTRLADLQHRLGDEVHAAPLWLRASKVAKSAQEAGRLARRACRAFLDSGDVGKAREALEALSRYPRSAETAELRVEIERRSENPAGLSEALEDMALSSLEAAPTRAALLVEAARAALAAGDLRRAIGQAQRAARIAHDAVEPQLFARLLEYRQRGAGTAEEARNTIADLGAVKGALSAEQRELRAFLLAEALDVARGGGAGMRELSQVHAALGDVTLVALGMAERLAGGDAPERALSLFDAALAGDLRGLRARHDVALAAAVAARAAGAFDRALRYLEQVGSDAPVKPRALELQVEIRSEQAAQRRPSDAPRRPSEAPPTEVVLTTRGVAPPAHGSAPAPPNHAAMPAPPEGSDAAAPIPLSRRSSEASGPRSAPLEPVARTTVAVETSVVPDAPTVREPTAIPLTRPRAPSINVSPRASLHATAPAKPTSMAPASEAAKTLMNGTPAVLPETSELAPEPPHLLTRSKAPPKPASRPPPAPAAGPPDSAPIPLVSPSPPVALSPVTPPPAGAGPSAPPTIETGAPVSVSDGDGEAALLRALEGGSVEAGRELVRRLEKDPDRSQDLVKACRQLSQLLPGDLDVLRRLHAAAQTDGARVYAEAIEHVLAAFRQDSEPVEPPGLVEQLEQAEGVVALLARDGGGPAAEALALVWNAVPHLFRRDAQSHGLTGGERIPASSPLPIARLFSAASTLLAASGTPLFIVREPRAPAPELILLQTPAVVVRGEPGEPSPSFAFRLGCCLAGRLAAHVLPLAAPAEQLRDVLGALRVAFGPPQGGSGQSASVAQLAGTLWDTVPARAQRRLSELCEDGATLAYDAAVAGSRQIARRFGLFVCGDVLVSLRETCVDLGIPADSLDRPGGLAALCASTPAVADLVRVATSPEFADARWRRLSGASRHLGAPWSRL